MVLLAVLFSKALTLIYLMLNEDVLVDRQYSHGAALTLRAYWASPESERPIIAKAAGLQLVHEHEVPMGETHWPYSDIFSEQMRAELVWAQIGFVYLYTRTHCVDSGCGILWLGF